MGSQLRAIRGLLALQGCGHFSEGCRVLIEGNHGCHFKGDVGAVFDEGLVQRGDVGFTDRESSSGVRCDAPLFDEPCLHVCLRHAENPDGVLQSVRIG